MKTATIYARFSTREQSEGTSITRQIEDCRRFAAERGWAVEADPLLDEGKSAFSGRNREHGSALFDYEMQVRSGLHRDTILLVERVDRLSRQGYDETSDFIKLLTANGVSVATVDGAEIYEAGKRLDTFQVIKLLLKAEVAHEESVKKSQRLKRRYEVDRAQARESGKAMTKNLPAWLCVGSNGKPKVRDNRDKVILRIYELADQGLGSLTITRLINAEFEPWVALNGQKTQQWNRSRIDRILKDRQVTGEYQPFSVVNGKRVENGEPWPDYFPRVVPHDLFERVRNAAGARQSPAGKRSTVVANLFSGLLRCDECGSWMLFERKRPAGTPYQKGRFVTKTDEASLRCSNNHFGKGCSNRATVAYYGFERAMLDSCLHLALDDRAFTSREDLSRVMASLSQARRRHEVATGKAQALWSAYAENVSPMAMQLASAAETQAAEIAVEIETLQREADTASGKAEAEAHLSRVAEFRRFLNDPDLEVRARHRTKVAQGFRTILKEVRFDAERGAHVSFVGDLRILRILRGKVVRDWNMRHRSGLPTGRNAVERAAIEAMARRMDEAA